MIRLTIETGSVTGIQSAPIRLVRILTPLTFSCRRSAHLYLFIAFPHQTFHTAPALLMPKLYANAGYMVLNSRFKIIGGRDTYESSTDISITTTMIRNIISSQSTDDTGPADGTQGQVPVVIIASEVSMKWPK